ncbi:MAG: NAD(P)H-dependent oxidoreductase subunit E, partial [Paracoccaceae bacterium]
MALDQNEGVWTAGRSGKRGRSQTKGRSLDDTALADVRALLGDQPRRRDLLIEFLHLIQDAHGHLSAAHLRALAEEMRLSMAEIWEVATFYAHFDPVRETETPPPDLTIRVCDSLSCELAGSEALIAALEAGHDPARVRVLRAPCMGRCDTAPVLEIGHRHVDHATPDAAQAVIDRGDFHAQIPDYETLAAYQADGGYEALTQLRADGDWEQVQETLLSSGLRGLGGAGFPSGRKWGFVRANPGPRYLAVNGDEGEPGTFKDRYYLERTPHLFLEGMLIAAWAVEADRVFIYMRDEYPAVLHILRTELAALEAAGVIAPGYVELRRGAGAYICGEESAMIESIEGKRGEPRHRPPFVAQVGVFGQPTLVHNVETL